MEAKFTPGPWEVWAGHLAIYAGPAKENQPGCIMGYRAQVADCEDGYDDGEMGIEEAESNARLIAAAPDLFKACQEMVADLRDRILSGTRFNPGTMHCIVEMESALAKATGEQVAS